MKSMYEKIKQRNLFYNYLFWLSIITFSIIIACMIIFFIIPMFKPYDIVPANIFVFENELSIKIQDEINTAVSTNSEDIYNRLLANIQLSIAFFSITLGIFAIVFGGIYFSKIRDTETVIKEIQKTPDLFFKHFYKEQFNDNISNLFSQDHIKRNDSINKLAFNPEISKKDYDILQDVLLNELNYSLHFYFNQNISTIIGVIRKIDEDKKIISFLVKFLKEQKYDHVKHCSILAHVVADNSPIVEAYMKDQLCNNVLLGTQLVSLLASNGTLNNYLGYILEKCYGSTLQMVLNMQSDMWHIDTDSFYSYLSLRDDIDPPSLHCIVSHRIIKSNEKISLVLHFYSKNPEKFDLPLNNLVTTIGSDENSKKEFLVIAEMPNYKELVIKYFAKNKQQIPYFTDIQDNVFFNKINDEKQVKTPSLVIEEHGLRISEDMTSIIDKYDVTHNVGLYSRSMFGQIVPIMYGVMIDGIFIDINELKKKM